MNSLDETHIKSTHVKFSVNLNGFENPLLDGEEIQVRGDFPPLLWAENISVNCIIFGSENELWIGTPFIGLFRFNFETGEFKHFATNPRISGPISANQINTAIRDQNGNLWFGTQSGLNRYNPDKNSFDHYFTDPSNRWGNLNKIYKMKDDADGNIWTQSDLDNGGVSCFNKKNKKFTHYSKGLELFLSSSITVDRSGIVWVGNRFRGLHKLNPDALKFSAFSIRKNGRDVLKGKHIIAVYEDQSGELWVGGGLDGLYRYNRKTGKSTVYRADPNHPDSIIFYWVRDILQDKKGIFWIGDFGGLNQFDHKTGRINRIEADPTMYLGLLRMTGIYEDINGILWLVTRNGYLAQFNPNTNEIEFYSVFGNSDIDRHMEFVDLIEDPGGFLWIATANWGLLKFDLNQKKLSIVEEIEKVNITSLHLDNDGILWCGTNGQGLIRYDPKTDTKIILRKKDGLLSNGIMGLEQDNSGNLWISSQKGLSRYNPRSGVFKHYFKEDGFLTNEFSYRAHFRCKNGEMIFGSTHGVVTFHPDSIRDSDFITPILLTDFKIHNKPVGIGENLPLKKHISVSDEIALSYDQNDISITFAALDFSHPQRNQYSFMLENFEEQWRSPGKERTAYYTNLDPGEYVFRVKGSNSDGVWNEEGASLTIIISPPFWATWWAYSLYVLFGLVLLHSLRRYELNRTQLKNQVKLEEVKLKEREETDRLKSRFFANISHEFRTPLTLILGPSEHIITESPSENAVKHAGTIKRSAKRLLELINQLLDLSKLEAGKLDLKASKGNIVSFIKGITMSFESVAEGKDITLKVIPLKENIELYFDKEKMTKIMTNLLSNALKFTPEGGGINVNVMTTSQVTSPLDKDGRQGGAVEIKVRDTGVGIKEEELPKLFDRFYQVDSSQTREHEGTGIGLALTKELIELHQGTISVDSKVGEWTEFTIELPLGRAHLTDDEIVETEEPIKDEITIDKEDFIPSVVEKADNTEVIGEDKNILLIVEDNADVREYIKDSLCDDFHIEEALNGEQGVRKAEKIIPDLIISDIMMPKMDGNELTRILKNDERTSHIPIILLTAKSEQQSKLEGLETGADDYLTKPFDTKELQIRIKNLISIRKKLQEKFSKEDFLTKPSGEKINSIDERFLTKVIKVIENHMSEEEFSIEECGSEVGMSRTHLYKKIKALIGKSPSQYVRTVRLNRAKKMVEEGKGNISEIAYSVGFSSPAYFSRCFKEEFGYPPSNILS